MHLTGRSSHFVTFLVLIVAVGFFSFASVAHAYISVSVMPETVLRGGSANIVSVFTGSYPATCDVRNVTDNRGLGTYVLNSPNDPNQNYSLSNIQSDKTVSLTCTDSTGRYEDTDTVTVSDTGSSSFQVSQYSSESVIAPGGTTKVESWSTQGLFPYQCTYTDSSGFRKELTITAGNRGPANPQSYVFERTLSPSATTTYTTDCTDAAGVRKSSSATVVVSNLPVLKLASGKTDLPDAGGDVQITVDVELATSCKTSEGTSAWQKESFPVSMYDGVIYSTPRYPITKTTVFSMECTNGAGSSGKKSVTIYVGAGSKCGNGVVDDVNEECDNGVAENSDTCPTTCTTQCKEFFCQNSKVNFVDKYSGSKADILMCSTHDGYGTTAANIRPGATVTYEWDAQNAKTCSRDFNDRLDPPFESCFPIVAEGAGSVSIPVKGSCSITAPTNLPEGENESFRFWCDDGAAGKVVSSYFQISRVDGNEAECIPYSNPGTETSIASFTVTPNRVPFGYTGDLTFNWQAVNDPEDGPTPECMLGYGFDNGSANGASQLTSWILGGKASAVLPMSQVNDAHPKYGQVPGTKRMEIICRPTGYNLYNGDDFDIEEMFIYFESDPNAAPLVSLAFGSKSDQNTDKVAQVVPNKVVSVYLQTGGAERCEYTLTGATTYAKTFTPMKVGETNQNHAFTGDTLITLECFNGTLSAKDTIAVTMNTSAPPLPPGSPAPGTPPTDNSKCDVGTPKASCNDATEQVVGRTKDGTGLCCLARTGSESVLYTIPISNPLAFNTVDEILTSLLGFLQAIIVILSLIMIVIGSIVYMTAGGNDSKLSTGKLIITAALIGLALALAAPSFLKEIGAILGWGAVDGSPADSAKSITQILTGILNFLLSVIGIIGIIMLVIGGLMYLTAAGDEDRINTGKSIVKYSLIGITVALAALVIISQIASFFG